GERFLVEAELCGQRLGQALQMFGRRLGCAADERESLVDDVGRRNVTELRQSALRAMLQFQWIESFGLVQFGLRQHEIADGLAAKVESWVSRWPEDWTGTGPLLAAPFPGARQTANECFRKMIVVVHGNRS